MPKLASKNGRSTRSASTTKYDAHHTVLSKTYGALADLRRELADSKAAVAEREEILRNFSHLRRFAARLAVAGGLLREALALAQGFPGQDWWPRLLAAKGKAAPGGAGLALPARQPAAAHRTGAHANLDRFAEVEQAEQEQKKLAGARELALPARAGASRRPARRAARRLPRPAAQRISPRFTRSRSSSICSARAPAKRSGRCARLIELTTRAAHEQELFPPADWEFIQWLAETHRRAPRRRRDAASCRTWNCCTGWRAGATRPRLELRRRRQAAPVPRPGRRADAAPGERRQANCPSPTGSRCPTARRVPLERGAVLQPATRRWRWWATPFICCATRRRPQLLEHWASKPAVPVRKLSHRLLMHLRKTQSSHGVDWEQLCVAHPAEAAVHLRTARRDRAPAPAGPQRARPERLALERPRMAAARAAERRAGGQAGDPRRPAPGARDAMAAPAGLVHARAGLWVGDANENFLGTLARAWPRPARRRPSISATRPFTGCSSRRASSSRRLIVKGSGIDWLAVSAEWEQEGLKLTPPILQRLADRHRPLRQTARLRLGRTGHRRRAIARTKRWPTWAWMA